MKLQLEGDERLLVHSCMNEILNGIPVRDFELQRGALSSMAKKILRVTRAPAEGDVVLVNVGRPQLEVILRAIRLVIADLGTEFQTRTGVKSRVAQQFADELELAVHRISE